MKLKEISYTRKYNLGNYETEDLSITAELYEQESPKTVWTELANIADDWHLSHVREKKAAQSAETAPAQRVAPLQAQPVKSPMQLANENSTVTWSPRPATSLGPYETTNNLDVPEISQIIIKCEEEQRAIDQNGYRYWTMKNKQTQVVEFLARRHL